MVTVSQANTGFPRRILPDSALFLPGIFSVLLVLWLPISGSAVVINEIMARNGGGLTSGTGLLLDEDGDASDWIELYNPDSRAVDLTGWSLTDDPEYQTRWVFPPGTTLGARQYRLVFASGKDRPAPSLHTDFRLAAEGGTITLVQPDGTVAYAYEPSYPSQLSDVSYGLAERDVTLIQTGAQTVFHVPEAADAGEDWQVRDYDDTHWQQARSVLGFTPQEVMAGQDIGGSGAAGSLVFDAGVYTVNGRGADLGGVADSFYYVHLPLRGDGGITARVLSLDSAFTGAKAGVMIRETLDPDAAHLSQVLVIDSGLQNQRRPRRGRETEMANLPERVTPVWVRVVRQGDSLSGYYSTDGQYWILHSTETLRMAQEVTMGLCVTANSTRGICQAIFDQVAFNADESSDLRQQMLGINASVWTRTEFYAEEVNEFQAMTCTLQYEDGFVAYLNGVEVARDNVTGQPAWNTQAAINRPHALRHASVAYDLAPFLPHLREGRNVLAIQGFNDEPGDAEFLLAPQLHARGDNPVPQYLSQATPGRENSPGSLHVVAAPQLSHGHGLYETPFQLSLSTETPGALIRYTTDGSPPSAVTGAVYREPISMHRTTCLRAVAVRAGWVSSEIQTQTYIFPAQVLTQLAAPAGFPADWGGQRVDYEMDPQVVNHPDYRQELVENLFSLPTMSLVMKTDDMFGRQGIYANSSRSGENWERPVSVEYFDADGSGGFHVNCGIRIYGGVGRRESKKTLRLLFKRQYGPTKLRYPLFGDDAVDTFDTIILRAGFNNSWHGVFNQGPQYIRDEWMRLTQLAMGHPSLHGTFVHLYINGLYWGLYNPVERCNADFGSRYLGGDKEDYDALNSYPRKVVDGSADAWTAAQSIAGAGVADQLGYASLSRYVDITNLADYMLLNIYGGNSDWDDHNWYSLRQRVDGAGWKFVSWDAERVLESTTGANRTGVNQHNKPSFLYANLRANPEFRLLFADRAHRHLFHDGALTPTQTVSRYQALADWVYPAMACESARWGDNQREPARTREDDWVPERDRLLNDYLPRRSDVVLGFLRNAGLYPDLAAPEFHINGTLQHGGRAQTGDRLTLTGVEDIYYTLDGSDPHVPVTVESHREVVFLEESAAKRAWVPTGAMGDAWRTDLLFNDTVWLGSDPQGPGGVGYERSSGYESFLGIDLLEQMSGVNTTCFIRIPFGVTHDQVAGINHLTLKMRYDDGFVAMLNGVEIARANAPGALSWNATATGQNSDSAAVTWEAFDISAAIEHLRVGDNLLAIQGLNVSTSSSDMLISAQLEGGEVTFSGDLLADTAIRYTGAIPLTESLHIKARALNGTAWSALHESRYVVGPVAENLRITEIMYHPADTDHPDDPNREYIELQNIGIETINLNQVAFTAGVDFRFSSLDLLPQQRCLVVRDMNAFTHTYGVDPLIAGVYRGRLDDAGETIELVDAAGTVLHRFRYRDRWYELTDGRGFSLTVKDPQGTALGAYDEKAAWRPSAAAGGSPGYDDSTLLPALGTVVINEVLTHSHAPSVDWIELHNTGDEALSIGGWFLSDDPEVLTKYEVAAGTLMAPQGYVVFYEDLHFNNRHDPGCHHPFALSEHGETLTLHSGTGGAVTGYRERETFGPSAADTSQGRIVKSTGTLNFAALSTPTPGAANALPRVGPVVISEIHYHPLEDSEAEYVELHNVSDEAVTLWDPEAGAPWRFTDDPENPGIELQFPVASPVTLAPGELMLLVKDVQRVRRAFAIPEDIVVLEWIEGQLGNGSERLELSKPGGLKGSDERQWIRVDRVVYSDGSHGDGFVAGTDPWPVDPDGYGLSLHRLDPLAYGNDPVNWKAALPTPGRRNP